MEESTFVKIFVEEAGKVFGEKITVKKGENLLYELFLDRNLEVAVKEIKAPKRGYSAFQTDICVFEKNGTVDYPRVAIEFKTKITTHDIITYSSKAGKHKQIYPGLRYGLLASELNTIPDRFFIHNENIDFFIAAKNYKEGEHLRVMIKELIETEINTSRILERINAGGERVNYYRTDIIFRNFTRE